NRYKAAAEAMIAAQNSMDVMGRVAASKDLDALAVELQTVYDELTGRAADRQNELGPIGQERVTVSTMVVLALGVFAVLIGALLAFVMGRWLSGAISGMTLMMRRLAEGEFDMDISGADRQDELGQMAKALQVFRTNGQAMVEADAERAQN